MPTFEYECESCGQKFDHHQAITELPLTECPQCGGKIRRLVSGGAGFIFKGSGHVRAEQNRQVCSLEEGGSTCCGRQERCGKPPCEEKA